MLSLKCRCAHFARTTKAYIKLTHPVSVLQWSAATVVFGCIAARGMPDPDLLIRMVVVIIGSKVFIGCTNDYCDRVIDARLKPWRPIPSGAVSEDSAIVIAAVSLVVTVLVSSGLGVVGIVGALVGIGAGLAHNLGLKASSFSWLPFAVGFSLHPLWIWLLTGHHITLGIAMMVLYALPLVIGLHFANQLPDTAERELGVRGLVHRLEPHWTLRLTEALLLFAPFLLLVPLLSGISEFPNFLFVPGLLIYFGFLGFSFVLYSKGPRYRSSRKALIAIRLGSLSLLSFWFMAMVWS